MSQNQINKIINIVEAEYLDRIVDLDPTTSLLESIGFIRELLITLLEECNNEIKDEIYNSLANGLCNYDKT